MLELLILIASIAVLSRSSSEVVDSALRLSRFFGISQLAMGFLLVAVATSLPELSVSITAASAGQGAIAAGNVFGSNIANIFLILGAGAFIYGITISRRNLKDIGLILLLTTLISVYIIFSSYVAGAALGVVEGAALLVIFSAYVWDILRKKKKVENGGSMPKIDKKKALSAFLVFCGGIIIVVISSAFVVDSAVAIASSLGLAQSFIGATLIAFGTSLPELTTAMQALRRGRHGLVLGNVIGSNITNLTLVLGSAALIGSIEVRLPVFAAALLFAVVANSILFYIAAINRKMARLGGILFLLAYGIYLALIFGLQVTELS
ncbi:MAG: sodium:calcium antiporter [Candidatus Micrarchaeota archaeon]